MKKRIKFLAIFLLVHIILSGLGQASAETKKLSIKRLAGLGRIQTSIEVCKEDYSSSDSVVLAGYSGEVDALTGTLLAVAKDAPLLLTLKDRVHPDLNAELQRLKVKNVYILGGEVAVHKEVEVELAKNYKVKRVAGENREATAIAVAKEVKGQTKHIFLAKGYGILADALAIGPVSAIKDRPVFLTQADHLSQTTIDAMEELGVRDITIIGGEGAISEAVEDQLKDYKVHRISGSNREKTALAIAEEYFTDSKKIIIANGYIFADALVGGYLGAKLNAPILLSNIDKISPNTKDYIKANNEIAYVLGGNNAISIEVYNEIKKDLQGAVVEKVPEIIKGNKVVDDLIDALPATKEIQITDKPRIGLARIRYDALTGKEKSLVKNINKLSLLESKIREVEEKTIVSFGGKFAWPVPSASRISSYFGYRIHPIFHTEKLHTGIDIPAKSGNDVVCASSGTVIRSGWIEGYGNTVMIDHGGGIVTLYAHNSLNLAKLGQCVGRGTPIAKIGSTGNSTGPHSHFEVRKDGKYVDPLPWVK